MTYRFIAGCIGTWLAIAVTAGWVMERLWS